MFLWFGVDIHRPVCDNLYMSFYEDSYNEYNEFGQDDFENLNQNEADDYRNETMEDCDSPDDDYVEDDEREDFRNEFQDPGGNSALRRATVNNPRNLPCPTCGCPDRLTPKDKQLGYQCDSCADRDEFGGGY